MNVHHEPRWALSGALVFALAAASVVNACAVGATVGQGLVGASGKSTTDGGVVVLADGSASGACVAPTVSCNDECVDTQTDVTNCGSCDNICVAQMNCQGGQCVLSTTPPGGGGDSSTGLGLDSAVGLGLDAGAGGFDTGLGFDAGFGGDDAGGFDAGEGFDAGSGGDGGYSCAHSPCRVGAALVAGCDDDSDFTVSIICDEDQPECCSVAWAQSCVDEANSLCQDPELGDICFDPGC